MKIGVADEFTSSGSILRTSGAQASGSIGMHSESNLPVAGFTEEQFGRLGEGLPSSADQGSPISNAWAKKVRGMTGEGKAP